MRISLAVVENDPSGDVRLRKTLGRIAGQRTHVLEMMLHTGGNIIPVSVPHEPKNPSLHLSSVNLKS